MVAGGFIMATANQATFPGFPFPNTTQIPNDVFDSLMPSLSGGELKVLLYICRRTFGFQKEHDRISLSQIAHGITTKTGKVLDHGTGLCKRQVINALKTLEKKNIIIITRSVDETGLNEVNTYSLNMAATACAEESRVHHGVVNENSPPVVNSGSPGVVHCSAPTKQREQKKEEQNKEYDDGVVKALEHFGMTPTVAYSLTQTYPAAYIREKLEMTRGLLSAESTLVAKNPVGWLRRAIEENYQPPRHSRRPTPPSGRKSQPRTEDTEKHQQEEQNSSITPPVALPQPDRETQEIWQQTVEHLKNDLPLGETKNRLTGTMLLEVTDTTATISVPNRYAIAWFERRLYSQIANALKGIVGKDVDLQSIAAS
jgi:phage replication O-like protein O